MQVNETPLEELKRMVIAQKTALLPPDASLSELRGLHDVLAEYDQLVSQVVIQVIQNLPVTLPEDRLQTMRADLNRRFASQNLSNNREVANYQKYKNRLDKMFELAAEVVQQRQ